MVVRTSNGRTYRISPKDGREGYSVISQAHPWGSLLLLFKKSRVEAEGRIIVGPEIGKPLTVVNTNGNVILATMPVVAISEK